MACRDFRHDRWCQLLTLCRGSDLDRRISFFLRDRRLRAAYLLHVKATSGCSLTMGVYQITPRLPTIGQKLSSIRVDQGPPTAIFSILLPQSLIGLARQFIIMVHVRLREFLVNLDPVLNHVSLERWIRDSLSLRLVTKSFLFSLVD